MNGREPGAVASRQDGKVLRVAYGGQFGSNTRTNAVTLKLSMPF